MASPAPSRPGRPGRRAPPPAPSPGSRGRIRQRSPARPPPRLLHFRVRGAGGRRSVAGGGATSGVGRRRGRDEARAGHRPSSRARAHARAAWLARPGWALRLRAPSWTLRQDGDVERARLNPEATEWADTGEMDCGYAGPGDRKKKHSKPCENSVRPVFVPVVSRATDWRWPILSERVLAEKGSYCVVLSLSVRIFSYYSVWSFAFHT